MKLVVVVVVVVVVVFVVVVVVVVFVVPLLIVAHDYLACPNVAVLYVFYCLSLNRLFHASH